MPTEEFLAQWYQRYDVLGERQPYYKALAGEKPWNTPEGKDIIAQFALVKRFADKISDAKLRVLDVGSGPGLFLEQVKRAGFEGVGIELNERAVEESKKRFGIEVHHGTLETISFESASFDIVTLWDLFEHVSDPRGLLNGVTQVIKPEGFLFIETPNVNSLLDRAVIALSRLGIKGPAIMFYGLHHLTLWNPKTLTNILNETGFRVREIHFSSTPPSRIFRSTTMKDYVMRLGVGFIQTLGKIFHTQNKMIVIAQKT